MKRNVAKGIACIRATFNNTIVTITDTNGDTLVRESAGTTGFKGSRKSTPYAAAMSGRREEVHRRPQEHPLRRATRRPVLCQRGEETRCD